MSMPAIAMLKTKDGRSFQKRVDFQKGDPRNPFLKEDFIAKFISNVEGRLPDKNIENLISIITNLENFEDLSSLIENAVQK